MIFVPLDQHTLPTVA